jgi:hypothetical protein
MDLLPRPGCRTGVSQQRRRWNAGSQLLLQTRPRRLCAGRARASAAAWQPWRDGNGERTSSPAQQAPAALPAQQQGAPNTDDTAASSRIDAFFLAAENAAEGAGDALRAAGHRLARFQRWLNRPEVLLWREGGQLLACLTFILLYVWR